MTRTYAERMSESILKQAMAFSMKLDIVFSALPGGDPSQGSELERFDEITQTKNYQEEGQMDPVRN